MKFCSKCGKEISDEAVICPNCGCPTADTSKAVKGGKSEAEFTPKSAKTANILGILSLLLLSPLAIPSLILAAKSKNETNGVMCKKAKSAVICSIIALCLWAVGLIVYFASI